jgi:tRNA nucleotidyltransferase (CCA-adding enzyme)
MSIRIDMPENANRIITTLEAAGYEAYIVGGCVRDSIMGRVPEDWDITTSARPEQVKELFKRTIDTGIQHGTVTVMYGTEGYEVTTYRIDGEYSDHRRPDKVEFTASLEEDLKRRDFTINAMAYSNKDGVIDMFGGMEDLDNKIIRAVGIAGERFDEDALRILRAIRFAGQLDFTIERDTKYAMITRAVHLQDISAERIRVELDKLLTSGHPERLIDAYVMGITAYILPEFDKMMEQPQNNPYHLYNVGVHSMEAVKNIEPVSVCRWAALLHDVGKPACHSVDENGIDHFYNHAEAGIDIAKKIMRRLKFDNASIDTVCKMIKWHDYGLSGLPNKKKFRRIISQMGADFFPMFMKIRKADMAAQSDYRLEEKQQIIADMERMYQEIIADADCLTIKDLAINGKDLINLGIKPGKDMGIILNHLLDTVLETPENNTPEKLTHIVTEEYLNK